MKKRFKLEGSVKIRNENGMQMVYMPDGTRIPHVIMTRVTDDINEVPVALIKLYVEIDDNSTDSDNTRP